MAHSQHSRRFIKHKRGYAGIIAAIFLVLVVLYLYYNLYMVAQNRNLAFQDATSQSQQIDFDRSIEQVTITDAIPSAGGVTLTIKNTGPLPVQLVRLWTQNSQGQSTTKSLSILLNSGSQKTQEFPIRVNDVFWFVTARGNLVTQNLI